VESVGAARAELSAARFGRERSLAGRSPAAPQQAARSPGLMAAPRQMALGSVAGCHQVLRKRPSRRSERSR
jgi:hypothetical protein